MRTQLTATAALSLLIAFTSIAQADDHRGERRHDRGNRHEQRRDHRADHGREHRRDHREWDRRTSRDHGRDRERYHRHERRWDGRHYDRDRRDHQRQEYRRYDGHRYAYREPQRHYRYDYPRYRRYHAGVYHRPYGYRTHRWYPGARLPVAYYAPRYVIYDYHADHLRPPPYGYHWVRVDNDVVLAAIASGIVMQVVNEIFW